MKMEKNNDKTYYRYITIISAFIAKESRRISLMKQ